MGCGIRDRVQKGYIPCKRIPTLNENDHRHVSISMEHERGGGGWEQGQWTQRIHLHS